MQKIDKQLRGQDVSAFSERICGDDTTQFVCRSQKNAGRDFEALLDRHLDFLTQRFQVAAVRAKYDIATLHVRPHVAELQRVIQQFQVGHLDDGVSTDVDRAKKRDDNRHDGDYSAPELWNNSNALRCPLLLTHFSARATMIFCLSEWDGLRHIFCPN